MAQPRKRPVHSRNNRIPNRPAKSLIARSVSSSSSETSRYTVS